jgi:predicted nucleic acid-binding protein
MIILDTSIWIEFLKQRNKDIDEKVSYLLEETEVVALTPIFGELLQGTKNEKEERSF